MPRIYVETYGCQMNVSDSELILGVLGRNGYTPTDDPSVADVILVNTCAVRDHAEQKVLSRMGELKRFKQPTAVLGVVGCMAQRLGPRLLERVPQVDLVVGPDGYRGLPELIARVRGGERAADVEFRRWEPLDHPVAELDRPAVFGEAVVPTAGKGDFVDVGLPVAGPSRGVVDLRPVAGDGAAGFGAPTVAGVQHDPLGCRGEAFRPTQVERFVGVFVEHREVVVGVGGHPD